MAQLRKNYREKNCYHCHLQKGRPTYVAVWKVSDKLQKIIEVVCVETLEKAVLLPPAQYFYAGYVAGSFVIGHTFAKTNYRYYQNWYFR